MAEVAAKAKERSSFLLKIETRVVLLGFEITTNKRIPTATEIKVLRPTTTVKKIVIIIGNINSRTVATDFRVTLTFCRIEDTFLKPIKKPRIVPTMKAGSPRMAIEDTLTPDK